MFSRTVQQNFIVTIKGPKSPSLSIGQEDCFGFYHPKVKVEETIKPKYLKLLKEGLILEFFFVFD